MLLSSHNRLLAVGLILLSARVGAAEDPQSPPIDPVRTAREAEFGKLLSGATFVGRYTDSTKPAGALPQEDRYTIHKVSKIRGDLWLFQTRIQYGKHDVTLPLPLRVVWAGDTPVITLDKVPVPGLGSFDARVLIHGKRYSGTWNGAGHGGHLFGHIEPEKKTDGPSETNPKNIVLIVADDQSPTAGCYGDAKIQTPHLDALAADGTRFDNAFCTTASCSASRSVILSGLFNHATGQYGHEHHFHHFRSYETMKTLPVLLRQLGYRTARIGKFHVGPKIVYDFDLALPGNSRSPVAMANRCEEVIRRESDQPFFLYFCTSDPHRGGGIAKELPHQPDRFGNRPPGRSYPGITEVKYELDDVTVPPFLPDTPACRAELAQYYQSISRIDQGLGRLIEILKDSGKYEETLILYTSDHGMAFPGGKTTLYEGGMQIPLIVRLPRQANKGIASDAMVSLVDIAPTLLDFAGGLADDGTIRKDLASAIIKQGNTRGAKNLDRHHGRSFLSAIGRQHVEGFDEVYASHTFHEIQMYYPMRVVRGRRFKLIWNIAHRLPFPFASDLWAAPTWQDRWRQGPETLYGKRTVHDYIHRAKFELFDLSVDPDETKNLATDSAYADVLAELQGKLKKFQRRTWDGWITKWDYE